MALTLIAALFSLALTIAILVTNPYRFPNQVFAAVTLLQSLWLVCVYLAMQSSVQLPSEIDNLNKWLRINAAIISFLPSAIWLLKNSIVMDGDKKEATLLTLPILAASTICVFLCNSDRFIYKSTNSGTLSKGYTYYIFILIIASIYIVCIVKIAQAMRSSSGIKRIELQFLALNAGGAGLLIGILNALGNLLNIRLFNRIGIFLGLSASALTAWALVFHQVFNAREILSRFGQRALVILLFASGLYAILHVISRHSIETLGIFISVGLCWPLAIWFDKKTRHWLDTEGERRLASIQQASIKLAHCELKSEKIISGFEALLSNETKSQFSIFLSETDAGYTSRGLSIAKSSAIFAMIRELGSATPEGLLRRRPSPQIKELRYFMESQGIALILSIPHRSLNPSLLLALGKKLDDRPFTYPEINRLQSLALLMDNLLAHSYLVAQDALNARIEYLALMSRGFAHDLKNLVTPVSSFLIHTDSYFRPGTQEADVHLAARRSMRVINDYIRETLFFAERCHPRFELVDIAEVCDEVCQLSKERAARLNVTVRLQSTAQVSLVADRVLLQRLLSNLVENAIDASSPGQQVSLLMDLAGPSRARLQVVDDGCGIPEENLPRVFDPYFTTKEFGEEVRGFGLGLTICQKIVLLHEGQITAQNKAEGGTIFTVELPLKQKPPRPNGNIHLRPVTNPAAR